MCKGLGDTLFLGGVQVQDLRYGIVKGLTYLKKYTLVPEFAFNPRSLDTLIKKFGISIKMFVAKKDGVESMVLDGNRYVLDWKICSKDPENMLWADDLIEVKYEPLNKSYHGCFSEQEGFQLRYKKKLDSISNLRLALLAKDLAIKGSDLESIILPSYDKIIEKISKALTK